MALTHAREHAAGETFGAELTEAVKGILTTKCDAKRVRNVVSTCRSPAFRQKLLLLMHGRSAC